MTDEERVRLHATLKAEFAKHDWSTFVDKPPSVAAGGRGVVIPGCAACGVRCNTTADFVNHLRESVLKVVDRELAAVAT